MSLDIKQELEKLPAQVYADLPTATPEPSALQVVSRQGRLMMSLSASTQSLDERFTELSAQLKERDARIDTLQDDKRIAQREAKQNALAAIHIMDALDWLAETLQERGDTELLPQLEAAQRDCLRRLATVGINEIPAEGMVDGNLHEALETQKEEGVVQGTIVKRIRRGYQRGTDVLRHAEVITAA